MDGQRRLGMRMEQLQGVIPVNRLMKVRRPHPTDAAAFRRALSASKHMLLHTSTNITNITLLFQGFPNYTQEWLTTVYQLSRTAGISESKKDLLNCNDSLSKKICLSLSKKLDNIISGKGCLYKCKTDRKLVRSAQCRSRRSNMDLQTSLFCPLRVTPSWHIDAVGHPKNNLSILIKQP